jgi:hypothetical protein
MESGNLLLAGSVISIMRPDIIYLKLLSQDTATLLMHCKFLVFWFLRIIHLKMFKEDRDALRRSN